MSDQLMANLNGLCAFKGGSQDMHVSCGETTRSRSEYCTACEAAARLAALRQENERLKAEKQPTIRATIERVIFETDAPEIVLAYDLLGGRYLCALTDLTKTGHYFLAIRISLSRLAEFERGEADLRTILTVPEEALHFHGVMLAGEEILRLETVTAVDEDWLPDSGFLMSAFGPSAAPSA